MNMDEHSFLDGPGITVSLFVYNVEMVHKYGMSFLWMSENALTLHPKQKAGTMGGHHLL